MHRTKRTSELSSLLVLPKGKARVPGSSSRDADKAERELGPFVYSMFINHLCFSMKFIILRSLQKDQTTNHYGFFGDM